MKVKKELKALIYSGTLALYLAITIKLGAYFYKVGVCKHYMIPRSLVQIQGGELMNFGIVLAVVAFASIFILIAGNPREKKFGKRLVYFYVILFAVFMLGFAVLYVTGNTYNTFLDLGLFSLISIIATVVLGTLFNGVCELVFRLDDKFYNSQETDENREKQGENENKKKPEDYMKKFVRKNLEHLQIAVVAIMILFIVPATMFFNGKEDAKIKKEYVYFSDNDEIVALISYENGYIVAPVENDVITPKFSYVELSDSSGIYTKSGKLTVGELN